MVSLRQTILWLLLAAASALPAQTTATFFLSNAGLNLRGLAFPDGVHGLAVGAAGLAVLSPDGGATFTLTGTGTDQDLSSLSMTDPQRGWAAGRAGVVLQTTDGGQTWQAQNSGTAADLQSIYFVTPQTGFAVGNSGTAIKTVDGGQTWAPLSTGVATQLNGVFFFNEQRGMIVGNSATLLQTLDGGLSWAPLTPPPGFTNSLLSIRFADAQNGWAGATQGRLLRTTDGGASWQLVSTGASFALFGLASAGPNTVWATGGNTTTGGVLHSTDGGLTWTSNFTATTRISALAMAGGQAWAAGDGGLVAHSADLQTWNVTRKPFSGAANAVDFVDTAPSDGWVAGTGGTLLHTTDAGLTWTLENTGASLDLLDVAAIATDRVVAVGGVGPVGSIFSGTLSGTTVSWTTTLNNGPAFQATHFPNATQGWAVGSAGAISISADGGASWTDQTSGQNAALTDVFFLDDQQGWAVGTSGIILKTTNGGATWSLVASPSSGILYGVQFVNASTGFIVGSGGLVLKSTDGGDTWASLSTPTTSFLNGLAFLDANEGVVVGNDGIVLRTADGGQTWDALVPPIKVFFWDVTVQQVDALGSSAFFITGNNGIVLRLMISKPNLGILTLDCPADVQVELLPGQTSASVSGLDPDAGTTCPNGDLAVSGGPAGPTFPVGATVVTYQATDGCGNTATCSFTVTAQSLPSCDTKMQGCIRFDLVDVTVDAGGERHYRMAIRNACQDQIDYVAFQLPAGVVAVSPTDNSVYTAPSGRSYGVRNPNFAPYYSIRFKAVVSPVSGQSDLFEYVLPEQSNPAFILTLVKFVSGKSTAAHLSTFNCLTPIEALEAYTPEAEAFERFIWNRDDRFAIAPNPTAGMALVTLPTRTDFSKPLTLFDAQGRIVREVNLPADATSHTLDLYDLHPGAYWLRLWRDDGTVESQVLVKQ